LNTFSTSKSINPEQETPAGRYRSAIYSGPDIAVKTSRL